MFIVAQKVKKRKGKKEKKEGDKEEKEVASVEGELPEHQLPPSFRGSERSFNPNPRVS